MSVATYVNPSKTTKMLRLLLLYLSGADSCADESPRAAQEADGLDITRTQTSGCGENQVHLMSVFQGKRSVTTANVWTFQG